MSAIADALTKRDAYLRQYPFRCGLLAVVLISAAGYFGFLFGSLSAVLVFSLAGGWGLALEHARFRGGSGVIRDFLLLMLTIWVIGWLLGITK
jgi:hypothetical protein